MTEGLSPIGPDDTQMTGDFEGVHTPEFQAELREEGSEKLEVEKIALDKLQNIRKTGVAFTEITKGVKSEEDFEKKLQSILSNGLLGRSSKTREDFIKGGADLKKIWADNVREKESLVFFNIVGRTALEINDSYYMQHHGEVPSVVIIFDLSRFKEVPFQMPDQGGRETFDHHTYRIWHPEEISTVGPSEWGFALSSRVPPRDFQGIVSTDPAIDDKILKIQKEVFKDKKELMLPIYDEVGELIWPREMTREEVRQFIAERDKDKKVEGDDDAGVA